MLSSTTRSLMNRGQRANKICVRYLTEAPNEKLEGKSVKMGKRLNFNLEVEHKMRESDKSNEKNGRRRRRRRTFFMGE